MKAKFAGLVLLTGMSLAANAATYHFTPITDPNNPNHLNTVINLGNQLSMEVTNGGSNNTLFTFRNSGGISSALSRIYFDDSPSNLFSTVAIQGGSGTDVDFRSVAASPLPGGSIPTFSFTTTHQFDSRDAVHNTTGANGEFLTLAATLRAGRTFSDVVTSLNAGDETDTSFLRIGLRLTSLDGIQDFCGCGISFLDRGVDSGGGAAPPPPIPEPETYGMLLAGLGLISAMARRRKGG
jgi:hypothetical protein